MWKHTSSSRSSARYRRVPDRFRYSGLWPVVPFHGVQASCGTRPVRSRSSSPTRRCAVLAVHRTLQPLGGEGDLVSPPTFAQPKGEEKGPRYVWADRRVGDEVVPTCLLDSPASQANRIEVALLSLVNAGRLVLPLHRIQVPGFGVLTDLELPHRVYDAAITTALLPDGTPWSESPIALAIRRATRLNARALFRHAPLVLVLGGWDSHSPDGVNAWRGRHAKAVYSKIVGIDARRFARPGGRLDPMGLPSSIKVDLGAGEKSLSASGLGVIPPSLPRMPRLSITMRHAEQRAAVSLGVLRNIGFGDSAADSLAREYLAALAVLCVVALHTQGGSLRAECDLVSVETTGWLVRTDGLDEERLNGVTLDTALEVVDAARAQLPPSLLLRTDPVDLVPHPRLIPLLNSSPPEDSEAEVG